MDDPGRNHERKRPIDDIIDHITADLQGYDGQYHVLGQPTTTQNSNWPTQQAPVFLQNPQTQINFQFDQLDQSRIKVSEINTYYYPTSQLNNSNNFIQFNRSGNNENHFKYPGPPPGINPDLNFVQYQRHQQEYGLFNRDAKLLQEDNCNVPNVHSRQLIDHLVGNWIPNQTGTYSPFGTPINVSEQKDASEISSQSSFNSSRIGVNASAIKKPRMVAEVKPMRPSYSDVLTKSLPSSSTPPPSNGSAPKISSATKVESSGRSKSNKSKKEANSAKSNPVLKRQHSSGSDEHNGCNNASQNGKSSAEKKSHSPGIRRWISLDDLNKTPSQDSFFNIAAEINDDSEFLQKKQSKKSLNTEKKGKNKTNSEDKKDVLNNRLGGVSNRKKPLNINSNNLQWGVSGKTTDKTFAKANKQQDESVRKVGKSEAGSTIKSKGGSRGNSFKTPAKKSQRTVKNKDVQTAYFYVLWNHWQTHSQKYALLLCSWFFHLLSDVVVMSWQLAFHLMGTFVEVLLMWLMETKTELKSMILNWRWWKKKDNKEKEKEKYEKTLNSSKRVSTLSSNISLPATGDEAMKRLLACKGKDPYSILGVTSGCTDDEIKKYYKRQAVLVHPDKNNQPGAEEAFKILVHAFELIGEPERRAQYERRVAETEQVEQAWSEMNDLLSQLHSKMEYAANTIRCTNCGKRHRRQLIERPHYAARFCSQCKIYHSAKEGDIWAESKLLGFVWHYYACMEGSVYNITEWAACQADNLRHLKANSHSVQYRIVVGKQQQQQANSSSSHHHHSHHHHHYQNNRANTEHDLEDFLNNLYSHPDGMDSRNRKKNKRKK